MPITILLLLTLHFTIVAGEPAADSAADSAALFPPVHVAVLDLNALGGISLEEIKSMSDRLRGELTATGRFIVLERGQMEDILQEQDFQQTFGGADTASAIRVGRLLAVRKILNGSIGKVGRVFSINIKMVDVETGRIERQVSDDIKGSKDELVSFHIKNVARELAGLQKLGTPWYLHWYARWYVWAPVLAAGAGAGLYVALSGDEEPADNHSMRSVPIEGFLR